MPEAVALAIESGNGRPILCLMLRVLILAAVDADCGDNAMLSSPCGTGCLRNQRLTMLWRTYSKSWWDLGSLMEVLAISLMEISGLKMSAVLPIKSLHAKLQGKALSSLKTCLAHSLPLSVSSIKSLAVIGPNADATGTMTGNFHGVTVTLFIRCELWVEWSLQYACPVATMWHVSQLSSRRLPTHQPQLTQRYSSWEAGHHCHHGRWWDGCSICERQP